MEPNMVTLAPPIDKPKLSKTLTSEKYNIKKKLNNFIEEPVNPTKENSINIFAKTSNSPLDEFNIEKEKPVGGLNLFLKEKLKKTKKCQLVKCTSEQHSSKVYLGQNNLKQKEKTVKNSSRIVQAKNSPVTAREEIYKTQQDYSNMLRKKRKSCSEEKRRIKQKSQQWAKNQGKNYHNKMGFLTEVWYRKPLDEIYGDRFFQFNLRNRYKDECPRSPYLYQVDQNTHREVEQNKFLKKLLKSKPSLKNHQYLVLKGRQISTVRQSMTQQETSPKSNTAEKGIKKDKKQSNMLRESSGRSYLR